MQIAEFSVATGLGGGLLIGLAAALLIVANGNIAGISGIAGTLLRKWDGSTVWRLLFVIGLLAGGVLVPWVSGTPLTMTVDVPTPLLMLAGLLVGFGTRLGSGCTSGHGVCGLARLSPRSLVATVTFMLCAAVTVYVVRHVAGA
ncbi:MAG: YeeE/YedE family protein [Pseudohongiellaceae bacterium]|jgi:uncharacterized membrane protein YedE/YeeE